MPIEELVRFRRDLKSNARLLARAQRIASEHHGVISLLGITGTVVEFANELGYNFSEAEVRRLLEKLAVVEEMTT